MNIEDLVGKTVVINSLSLDNDNETATVFSIVGKLRHSYKERFFIELYMKNNQYSFLGFHKDKIVGIERNLDDQIVITIKD